MLEETTSLDYVMEKASGPHFFDLRSLIAIAAVSAFTDTNAHHQSFVIGPYLIQFQMTYSVYNGQHQQHLR
ncbi:hypothetical protein V6N12_073870 [Hibiscus sabdariffa]|uniref:Uncharacterized protein n=1 Tax=Hibiscus sabdariffa TaxID=183260 RepID=A0ABR2AKC8_9ROSI